MTRGAACIVTAGLRPTSTMQAESKKEKSGVSVLSRCMLKNCINIQPLLTDVGFVACPLLHGDFAACLLGAYVSDRNHWMLQHHATFQNLHSPHFPGVDPHERERWRANPHFDWTAEFVARYDQAACDPLYVCEPLDTFVPMVRRLFAKKPVDRRSTRKIQQ